MSINSLTDGQLKNLLYWSVDAATPCYADNDAAHDLHHVRRVFHTATHIGKTHSDVIGRSDMFAALFAAVFHDVVQNKPSNGDDVEKSAVFAYDYLMSAKLIHGIDLGNEFIDKVCDTIKMGSYEFSRNNGHDRAVLNDTLPVSAKLLFDADILDSIGCTGICRVFLYGGAHNVSVAGSIQHFHDRLLGSKDLMYFSKSQEIALEKHRKMEKFLKEFDKENYSTEGWSGIF